MKRTNVIRLLLGALCLWLASNTNAAWKGFDWNEWLKITNAAAPTIQTPQSGRTDFVPLLVSDDGKPIDSIQDWETKRDRILDTLKVMIGEPTDLDLLPPRAELIDTVDMGAYTRSHLRIRSEKDDWIPTFLLKPKNLPNDPMPTMIVLHQTVAQGKDEPCGIQGNPELALAVELAERGWICTVPDAIGFGERTPAGAEPYYGALDFFRKHPHWSFFGKMIWDVQRIVDYLETLPEVDPYRIGCIGHSHGAYGTIMATIFEPRISAAAASCGFTTLRADPQPNRWSHLTCLMPSLGFYMNDIGQTPFDWHEIAACVAPRPYLNWATLNDSIFSNTENLQSIFQEVKNVYALYGATDNLNARLAPGQHAFPKDERENAYRWLREKIPPRHQMDPVRTSVPTSITEWETTKERIKKLLLKDIGPIDPPSLPTVFETIATVEKEDYTEKKIRYQVDNDDFVNAYLLLPHDIAKPCQAAIVFHQTTELGKEEAAGHAGRASIHFGPELSKRGYVVLCPDSICAGERITDSGSFDTRDFYRSHPTQSAMGKMIQDGRRAIDMLCAMPEVDPSKIVTIGHSLGAEEALFTAAFDERIKAAAASCGYAPVRDDSNPERWARDRWFSYLPRLRIDLRANRLPAWDFDDVIRLIAPRGYYNYQTTDDQIFPDAGTAHEYALVAKPLWKLYDAEPNLQSLLEPGPHDVTPTAKASIYEWMDRVLSHTKSSPQWWERETTMHQGGILHLSNKPWWPLAARLQPGEQICVRSTFDNNNQMLIRNEKRTRGEGSMLVWILDDDGDMNETDPKGDKDSDCYIADYGADGVADRMVDYIDTNGDNQADEMDIRYFVNGELRNVWVGVDRDGDGEMWDTADYEYTGDFFKSDPYGNGEIYMNKYDPIHHRWLPISECPFAFYDTDGDGESEIALRFSGAPLTFSAEENPDYANNSNRYQGAYDESMTQMGVVNVRYSFDADGLSRPGDPLHYEMGFTMTGDLPYKFDGMERSQPRRREPKVTVCVPYDGARNVAETYKAKETGFTWREFPDASIDIGHPSRLDYDRRWEGVFWTWQRRILHNTGGPVQEWNTRREYCPTETVKRELYYSPVDRRLHLKGATDGWILIGNIVEKKPIGEIRLFDTNMDGYFDRWEYFDTGNPQPYRIATMTNVEERDFGNDWNTAFTFYNQVIMPESIEQNRRFLAEIEKLGDNFKPLDIAEYETALTTLITPGERRYILDLYRETYYRFFKNTVREKAEAFLDTNNQTDPRRDAERMKRSTLGWKVLTELARIDRLYERGAFADATEHIQNISEIIKEMEEN